MYIAKIKIKNIAATKISHTWLGDLLPFTVFAKNVFIDQEGKSEAHRRSDTILVLTTNNADQQSVAVVSMTRQAARVAKTGKYNESANRNGHTHIPITRPK